jgi:transcriptional regulator with XRE-family HTH domain
MDDIRVGRGLRRLRHRRTLTQEQIAALCDESQDSVSRIERGHLADMPLRRVRAIARALDAETVVALRWRGGDLDRLMDEGHAVIVGRVAGLLEGPDGSAGQRFRIRSTGSAVPSICWRGTRRREPCSLSR